MTYKLKKRKSVCLCFVLGALFSAGTVWGANARQWSTQLDNGMKIVIIEDHSLPLAASVVNIHAGSHTETIASNGLSHLLEHMLFNGTTNRTGEELKSQVSAQGGYFNAYTRKDYVAFEIVMPSHVFLEGLEIQADQLLHSTLPESELEREKKVVCEEIAQDVRSASQAAENAALELLFGPTGYGLPIIGNYTTVNNAMQEQLAGFFHSRYVPNKMTAVIVGDVDPDDVLKTLRRLYGAIPPGLENVGPGQKPVFPEKGGHKIVNRPVNGSAVSMILPAPPITDPSYMAFEAAVAFWAQKPDSSFQRRMKSLSTSAFAHLSPHNGFSLLMISIKPSEDALNNDPLILLENLQKALSASIDDYKASGATEQDVVRYIRSARVDHEFARERTNHLARDIGELAALDVLDNYWYFDQRIQSLSRQQVNQAFSEWLTGIEPVAVLVQPDDQNEGFGEQPVEINSAAVETLSNGLTVISQYDPYADLTAINLLLPNPPADYPGIPRIVAELLDAGTGSLSGQELNDALADKGIRVKLADWPWLPFDDYYDSIEYNYLQMECLAEDFSEALHLFGQMVFDSTLPDDACDDVLKRLLPLTENAGKSSSSISAKLLKKALFASEYHRQSRLPRMEDMALFTPEMLRKYYSEAYAPSTAVVSVVGNVLPEIVFEHARKHLAAYPAKPASAVPAVALNSPDRSFQNVDDATASVRAALPLEITPDTLPAWMVVASLLSDRLQEEIRYRRGRAYRLGAGLTEMAGCTLLEIGIGTRGENLAEVEAAARDIVDGISKIRFDDADISASIKNLLGHEWRYRQRRINRAYFLAWRHWLGYGVEYEGLWTDRIAKVSIETVKQAVRSIKSADQWYWAVAGMESPKQDSDNGDGKTGVDHEY